MTETTETETVDTMSVQVCSTQDPDCVSTPPSPPVRSPMGGWWWCREAWSKHGTPPPPSYGSMEGMDSSEGQV